MTISSKLVSFSATAVFLAALLFAENVLVPSSLESRRVAITLGLCIYGIVTTILSSLSVRIEHDTGLRLDFRHICWVGIRVAVLALGVATILLGSSRSVLVAGLIISFALLGYGNQRGEYLALLVRATIVYFVLTRLPELISIDEWLGKSLFAFTVSSSVSAYHETTAQFSAGVLGWNTLILIVALLLVAITRVAWQRLVVIACTATGLPIAAMMFLSPQKFDLTFVNLTSLIWLGFVMTPAVFIGYNTKSATTIEPTFSSRKRRSLMMPSSIGVFPVAGLVLGAAFTNWDTYLQPHSARIAIHNRGGLDWKRSTFEKSSGGMFGELPFALDRSGHKLKLLDEDDISADMLLDQQVLLLINSSKTWKADEMAAIHGFVDRGGTLLVLGDHTNVFGLQESFNQLLDPYGIEFQFDSAYYLRKGWRGCITTSSGIMEGPWEEHLPGIGIGASLKLSKGARSLVTGRYAFSDRGYEENVVGSFLGNYAYVPGERAGELCLVATTASGRGRVVVFGDTSTFQGGVNVQLQKVILPLMETICRPPGFFERSAGKTFAAVLAIGAMILLVVYPQLSGLSFIAPMFITMVAAQFLMPSHSLKDHVSADSVLIAKCNVLEIGHSDISLNAIWPLYSLISKSGLRYYDLDRWDHEIVKQARAIAFVAPTKRIEGTQLEELLDYEEAGGIVLVSAGYDHYPAVKSLLDRHRLALKNEPIGTATYLPGDTPENRRYPRLYDAWPITSSNETKIEERDDVEILLGYGGEACIVFCPRGQGGLLLISDSRFFSTRNIENFPHFEWEGNVQFVRQLFIEKLRTQPDLIKDYFPSPPQADE